MAIIHNPLLRFDRRAYVCALATVILLCSLSLNAQQSYAPLVPLSPATASATHCDDAADSSSAECSSEGARSIAPGSAASAVPSSALSSEQIMSVLQQQPDTVVEIKSIIFSRAQQQGIPIAVDTLSDEVLYSQIASSPELRISITNFLQARGYVAQDDVADLSAARDTFTSLPALPSSTIEDRRSGQRTTTDARSASATARRTQLANRNPELDTPPAHNEPQVLHQPTPSNLLSLRDLYVQLPEQSERLKRFGSDVFLHRDAGAGNQLSQHSSEISLDAPASPGYIVGPGDTLAIELWGGIAQSLTRTVDREGRIALPESGSIAIAGLELERVQSVLAAALQQQYRNVQVAVTIARLRSIRVYVVGDVQRPGAYDVSAQSTSLNALYAAGGPTGIGSLRLLRHYRGQQLIAEIDLYDFLLHGVQHEDRLQSGDTLLVPPTGPQVAISGAVKRPALYELKGETTLGGLLEAAGGATVSAALGHIIVDRIDAKHARQTISLDLPATSDADSTRAALAAFLVHDGDRIRVAPIQPYSQEVIYLAGHVLRPGRTAYHEGMHINDVLHTYRDLLPEPADKAEIIRLVAPDLRPETIDFNLPDALIGNDTRLLEPFDTIRIYGRYEADAPKVSVGGEVLRPGFYPLSSGMTAARLVRMAGGFKRDALLDSADLTSYRVESGNRVVSDRTSIPIGTAVLHQDSRTDVLLKPGDVLTIHQIAGWNDIGSSITIEGEVAHPGIYGIQQGERLSSILRRAGSLRDASYPAGAVLLRDEVRRLEEKSREELIHQIESGSAAARIGPNLTNGDQTATLQLVAQQQQQVLARLRSQPAVGRLVIHISADITRWENTPDDIEVRAGDVLRIPKQPGFVLISGQVYNTSAITYTPNQTAESYLRRAGGATDLANKRDIFIIRANGSVVGRDPRLLIGHNVLTTRLNPGDVIVVPQKIIGASQFWRNLLTVGQITSSIAITAAVAGLL